MMKQQSLKFGLEREVSARDSMASDTAMFLNFESGEAPPTARIYSWARPSVTLGYSQKIEEELDVPLCEELGIDLAKRPTGGGILFHTREEIAFGIVMPFDEQRALRATSQALLDFLAHFGIKAEISNKKGGACLAGRQGDGRYCFSYPSNNEILVNGKKIIGLAQKVGRSCVLQQGAIFVSDGSDEMLKVLKKPFDRADLLSSATNLSELISSIPNFEKMSGSLAKSFEKCFKAKLDV
jgi:lipoate-protein ligase A